MTQTSGRPRGVLQNQGCSLATQGRRAWYGITPLLANHELPPLRGVLDLAGGLRRGYAAGNCHPVVFPAFVPVNYQVLVLEGFTFDSTHMDRSERHVLLEK